jgi:hypothetical protein
MAFRIGGKEYVAMVCGEVGAPTQSTYKTILLVFSDEPLNPNKLRNLSVLIELGNQRCTNVRHRDFTYFCG